MVRLTFVNGPSLPQGHYTLAILKPKYSGEVTYLNIDVCRQLSLTSPIKFETDFTLIEEY